MTEQTQSAKATKPTGLTITKDLLKEWSACTSGYSWFIKRFPHGAPCHEVAQALREDKRYADERWLFVNVFNTFIAHPEIIAAVVRQDIDTQVSAGAALITELSTSSEAGIYSRLAASSIYSTLAASGNYSTLAAAGNYSTLAASGYGSRLAASGNGSMLAASGNDSMLAASGNDSRLAASGLRSVAMAAGFGSIASAGEHGAFAIAWLDDKQVRIAVGVVGENGIKAGVLYCVNGSGALVEVEA